MKEDMDQGIFEKNLQKLLSTVFSESDEGFEESVTRGVLAEIKKQRIKLFARRLSYAAAAAAAGIVIVSLLVTHQTRIEGIGYVRNLYGIVMLKNGNSPKKVEGISDIRPGQWVETLSGSKAEIVLKDKSKLLQEPRTTLQITKKAGNQMVLLKRGATAIEATKKSPGNYLAIKSAGSLVKVLGTKLELWQAKTPEGTKRTYVRVASGTVEVESAGKTVLLSANTEGIADTGTPPIKRSLIQELNEINHLLQENKRLARDKNMKAGLPVIIDYKDSNVSTVWTIVPHEELQKVKGNLYSLTLRNKYSGLEVYTLDGTEIPAYLEKRNLQIDLSELHTETTQLPYIVLMVPKVRGLFKAHNESVVFTRPIAVSESLSLIQFRLPETANLEHISPAPIKVAKHLNKLIVLIPCTFRTEELL